ncbi:MULTISPECIES: DUF2057 domain-containing protein [Shewanella]|uniref:DUF2057 domain-containing protein n=1 Tax=Shewanella TaxID=22 RepID=UPI0004911CAC|nr:MULTISPECIES: DUF2057 domain-containing protein [Shewanella]MBO2553040.1 DUF2057 domain-containing protein [Shewanella algae]MBO2616694.1 DUF2057 domain-containing protein [Shewanella algae]MBO2641865.1 DUF2057 domain-containing protein [Shewanella algae]MBO2650206.1 DUF2057 domain-containing protein [Shewanella algae]OHY55848.1 hypothetical protein BEH76_02360 [Shewanella algae]
MKLRLTASALLALLSTSSVFAANLTIPMSFEYLALDGKEIETSNFNHKSELPLSEGVHKIAIRYHDMIDDEFSDSQSFVKSSPFILTLKAEGDNEYILKPADGDYVKKPKEFAKTPQVVITRADKGQVNYQVELTQLKETSFLSQLFSGNNGPDVETAAAAVTAGNMAASQPVAPVSKPSPVSAMTMPSNAPQAAGQNGDSAAHAQQMLQYWWLQADEATRKEFMSWAIKQL